MYQLVDRVVNVLKKIIPRSVAEPFLPLYHAGLAFFLSLAYGFPARKLVVIGVTGTKGKSTVAEMLFAILRAAGYKTALLSTIRFALDDASEPNLFKMTLAGRGFVPAFMRRALNAGCTHMVIEVTSESVLQYRHWFLNLDGLIVTNIQREHIERHGSFENYVAAKRAIVSALEHSPKSARILVTNEDVPETTSFLSAHVTESVGFGAHELARLAGDDHSTTFTYKNVEFRIPLPGAFNALNALSAIKMGNALGISLTTIQEALASLPAVRGRVEHVDAGQTFLVIVDYAHTPDSLKALYDAFPTHQKICVLGNTGGGRDRWKRPEMGRVADEYCKEIILTNEDPYDENPEEILQAMASGMKRKPRIILDRREAIRTALSLAGPDDAVLVSGKGTDPFIMGPKGEKTAWSDAQVVREELERLVKKV